MSGRVTKVRLRDERVDAANWEDQAGSLVKFPERKASEYALLHQLQPGVSVASWTVSYFARN